MNTNKKSNWTVGRWAMALLAAAAFLAVPGAKAASPADKDFLLRAIQAGMTEVRLGDMANLKGNRADVKEFGHLIVRDDATLNDDLKALAQQKGLPFPDSLDAKHQAMVDKLVDLTSSQFDNAYIATMTTELTALAKEFSDESAATHDPDIKTVVDKSILIVNQHLKEITAMR